MGRVFEAADNGVLWVGGIEKRKGNIVNDYIVKDIALAEFGRKELNIAET